MTDIINLSHGPWQGFGRSDCADTIFAAMQDPGELAERLDPGMGRGEVYRLPLDGGQAAIIRRFRRGGFIRHFLRDQYLFDNRPLHEWKVTLEIARRGLPIAQPLAVVWKQRGIAYSGLIATAAVDGPSLAAMRGKALSDEMLEDVGRTIARFHDCAVYHADLNAGNILLSEGGPVIIDWDRGEACNDHAPTRAAANLARLQRSLTKLGFDADSFISIQRGYHDGFTVSQSGNVTRWSRGGEREWSLFDVDGDVIKESSKALSLRTSIGYVKRTPRTWMSAVRCAARPERFRGNFTAALRLRRAGIRVAQPIGYEERRVGGFVVEQASAAEALDDWVNVEVHARGMVDGAATDDEVAAYLRGLAQSVRGPADAGIDHGDLSGKNIFTQSGEEFAFIDLDSVRSAYGVSESALLKRDIQLYDSFCDMWSDELLGQFVAELHGGELPRGDWFEAVRAGQSARRSRTEEIWKKAGHPLDEGSPNG